ncbi:uncharacterized protein LOC108734748 [Agrilus planipennis]|uniref:Uncharacterized protein LOC108734748 n=1 Tax=Agrilus planipennis TaxID=224129 RepID=A0A1W4WP80_AGRPL|nr:uncharacterized protein LOC108734748 [Agrilus planipennis]
MEQQENLLNKMVKEIAKENKFVNPKTTIFETVKNGYLGIPHKISIEETNKSGGKGKSLHLFLKSAPTGSRDVLPFRDAFLNEITMYEEVLPTFFKFQKEKGVKEPFESITKCYKSCSVENQELLIFDDLTKHNFLLWDKVVPMTKKSIEFVVKQSAKYHAVSFAIREQRFDVFNKLTSKLSLRAFHDFCKSSSILQTLVVNAQFALKCFDPRADEQIYNKFNHFLENDLKETALGNSGGNDVVIIHGDSWCNNFMFKFKDPNNPDDVEEMKFLDWQFSRLASPVIDLSYFFYCNGPQEAFDNLEHYMKLYHNTLGTSLKDMGTDVEKVFPYSTFKNHWRKYAKFGLAVACTLINIYYNPNHNEALNISELMESGSNFAETFANSEILDNQTYKKRMRGVVTHFVNNGFI